MYLYFVSGTNTFLVWTADGLWAGEVEGASGSEINAFYFSLLRSPAGVDLQINVCQCDVSFSRARFEKRSNNLIETLANRLQRPRRRSNDQMNRYDSYLSGWKTADNVLCYVLRKCSLTRVVRLTSTSRRGE